MFFLVRKQLENEIVKKFVSEDGTLREVRSTSDVGDG
jgi:hypothetical protein